MDFVPVNSIKRIGLSTDGEVEPASLKRMGVFAVRRHVLEKYPQVMLKIFEKVVPLEMENSFVKDCITYTGYSHEFDETPEGSVIPEYEVLFSQDLTGNVTIKFKKSGVEQQSLSYRKVTFF